MGYVPEAGKYKIWTVDGNDYQPTSYSSFTERYGYVVKWTIKHKLGQIGEFEGEAYGLTNSTLRNDFKANNYLFVNSGLYLLGKFVILTPTYETQGKTKLKAIQSTGSLQKKKTLLRTNTNKEIFKQEYLNVILEHGSDPIGITRDSNGSIIELDWGGSPNPQLTLTVDYTNRIEALKKVCNLGKKEWIIKHEDLATTKFVDFVSVYERIGSSSTAMTLHLSGPDTNCSTGSGAEELDTATNHIILKGRDNSGKQVETWAADYTTWKTTLSERLDGWLDGSNDGVRYENLSAFLTVDDEILMKLGGSFINVNHDGFYIKIDNEVIKVRDPHSTSYGEAVYIVERGSKVSGATTNTIPAKHKAGADIVLVDDGNNVLPPATPNVPYVRIYCDDTSLFPSAGSVYVGSELIVYNGKTSTYLKGIRSSSSSGNWSDVYAHETGTQVRDANLYSIENPQPGTSIEDDGLMTYTTTDNTAISKDSLDRKAQQMLESKEIPSGDNGNKIVAITVSDPETAFATITNNGTNTLLGTKVRVEDSDAINLPDGDYRVVEYEYTWPPQKLILYLNSEDTRAYVDGSFDFAESMNESQMPEMQDPTRKSDQQKKEGADNDDDTSGDFFTGKVDNVVVPEGAWGGQDPKTWILTDDDSTAASVGWTKSQLGGVGPGGLWTESGTEIFPYIDRAVVPFTDSALGSSLGAATRKWYEVWSNYGYFGATPSAGNYTLSAVSAGDGTGIAAFSTAAGTALTADSDGAGDALRAGYNAGAPGEGWNFRVTDWWIGFYNSLVAFSDDNPQPDLYFRHSDIGIRRNTGTNQLEFKDTVANGGAWTPLSSLFSSGFWEDVGGGYLRPTTSYNIIPNGTGYDLGQTGTSETWRDLHLYGDIYFPQAMISDETGVLSLWAWSGSGTFLAMEMNNSEIIAHNDLIPSSNIRSLGTTTDRWADVWTVGTVYADAGASFGGPINGNNGACYAYNMGDILPFPTSRTKKVGNDTNWWYGVYSDRYFIADDSTVMYSVAGSIYFIDDDYPTGVKLADLGGVSYWSDSGTFLSPVATGRGISVYNFSGTAAIFDSGSGDSLNAGDYGGGNYNLRVSSGWVGIYNGALSLQHQGWIQDLAPSDAGGIWLDTSSDVNTWKIYGGTNNLIFDKPTGSAGNIQFDENLAMSGTGPSKNIYFGTTTVRVYRDGNDMMFEDLTANAGSPVSLNDLYSGATGSYWDRASGYGGSNYVFPDTETDKVRIDATGDNIFLAGRYGAIGTDEYAFRVSPGWVGVYSGMGLDANPLVGAGVFDIGYAASNEITCNFSAMSINGNSGIDYQFKDNGTLICNIDSLGILIGSRTFFGGKIQFDSSVNNNITDDSSDLFVQGNTGLYLQLNTNGGAVIVGGSSTNVSTLRPNGDKQTDLGTSYAQWKDLHVGGIYLDGVYRTTWPGGGGGVTSVTSADTGIVVSPTTGAVVLDLNTYGSTPSVTVVSGSPGTSPQAARGDHSHQGVYGIYAGTGISVSQNFGSVTITNTASGGSFHDHDHGSAGYEGGDTLNPDEIDMTGPIYMNGNGLVDVYGIVSETGDDIYMTADDEIYLDAGGDITLDSGDDIWLEPGDDMIYDNSSTSSRFYPYYDCTNDLGASNSPWDDVYCEDLNDNYCDVAELQFVANDVEVGDIVELGDWDNPDEQTFFNKEVEEHERVLKMNPNKSRMRYVGLQGKWKRASVNSFRCPSVVSLQPGVRMGARESRMELYKSGKMKYIALSGSIPMVSIEGDFNAGDIIVSAGNGKGKVDNDAQWNRVVGYAKRSGKDERCEIWVR